MTRYMKIACSRLGLPNTKLTLIAAVLLLFLQVPGWTQAPARAVSGTVLTDKGAAIVGASVSISGSARGTITDAKGSFRLFAPENAILVITYVGYDTIHVRAQNVVQITLHPSAGSLNDVIVIGYGTAKRKDLTGSLAV